MRFKEFRPNREIEELSDQDIPILDPNKISGPALQAVRNVNKMVQQKISPVGKTNPNQPTTPQEKLPEIPAVGTEIVLPGKSRPVKYKVKQDTSGGVKISPSQKKLNITDPDVELTVPKKNLQSILNITQPDIQDKRKL